MRENKIENWCVRHYESDCHGIDMLKNGSSEVCAGGTDHPLRFHFCPFCGAPRPEPRKTLAEKLADTYNKELYTLGVSTCEKLSKAAVDHCCEVIDSITPKENNPYMNLIDPNFLKQKLRESQ